jgi:hypothetical protein
MILWRNVTRILIPWRKVARIWIVLNKDPLLGIHFIVFLNFSLPGGMFPACSDRSE